MKIALCLHGYFDSQTDSRSLGEDGFEHIRSRVISVSEKLGFEVDSYIHSWEPHLHEKINTLYKPKSFLYQPQIDFSSIDTKTAREAKMLWINYPNNPTGAIANIDFFREAVEFCKEFDIALMHDACYTEVTYDGYVAPSILEVPGAMDISIEFH